MGYECEFVVPPPGQLQMDCSICLLVLREPHLILCCGNSFCAACIGRIEGDGKPCPLCKEPTIKHVPNLGLKRTLGEFEVRCPNRVRGSVRGCEWVGKLGGLDDHLNSDPQTKRQLEGCQFAVIECTYCKEGIRRDMIMAHQLERCPQRPYTCEYCSEYNSTFADVAHSHWLECKCFPLPCPNNCTLSGSGIKRRNLAHHVEEECSLAEVQCEFRHVGCEVTLSRRDMANHMKEKLTSHISLLAAENHYLSKQVMEREEQICSLSRRNTELEEKIVKQSEDTKRAKDQLKELNEKGDRVTELQLHLAQTPRLNIDQLQTKQQQRMYIELRSVNVPVAIKMAGFDELKKTDTAWCSRPFYTCMGGYKMYIKVYANGGEGGRGTHVSVFTCLMRGESDACLKWPFRGKIAVQLVNQFEDTNHFTDFICYTNKQCDRSATRVTYGERSDIGWGKHQYIPHSKLGLNVARNRQYLKDDCLIFRIVSVKLK